MASPQVLRSVRVAAVSSLSTRAAVCRSEDGQTAETAPPPVAAQAAETASATAPAFDRIHGLGGAEGTPYVATHTGPFRGPAASRTPRLAGDTRRDAMGFPVMAWRAVDQQLAGLLAGSAGGQPGDLYVTLSDSTVRRSTDAGATWAVRAAP